MKNSKDILKDLITYLMDKLKLNQRELSKDAGYEYETLTQVLSKKEGHDAVIKKLKLVYRETLKNSIFDDKSKKEDDKTKHQDIRNKLKDDGENNGGTQIFESSSVPASFKTVYHDEHQVPDYVLKIPQFRNCNYGTRASGDSMYPEIRNGDLVICQELDRNARIIFGDIYIVHTDEIETIKYIKEHSNPKWVWLVPHNKAAGEGTPIPKKEIIKLFKVRAIFKAY